MAFKNSEQGLAAKIADLPLGLYTESLVGFLSSSSPQAAFAGLVSLMAESFPQAAPLMLVGSDEGGWRVYAALDELSANREAERLLGRKARFKPAAVAVQARLADERLDLDVLLYEGEQVLLSLNRGSHERFFEEWVKILAPGVRQLLATEHLKRLAYRDGLTGVFNRRAWQEMLESEAERARRYAGRLAVIMLDIDWFKRINDGFGHQCGDTVLAGVAAAIGECCRKSDLVFRLGGDEFALLLPQTELMAARRLAERICRRIGERDFGGGLRVSASIGVSEYQTGFEPGQILHRADQGLYQAKAGGGNRVEIMKGVQ